MKLWIKRTFTRLFHLFPVQKDKVFFSSYEGKQYSCNPKYIYEQMLALGIEGLHYVWEYNNPSCLPEELQRDEVDTAVHNSLPYFYHLITAGTIVTNSGISGSIVLRKSQTCINTWHGGGAYKKVGTAISEDINGTSRKELKLMAENTTYFLSSSRAFTDVMVDSTLVCRDKFLEVGMPRNDLFFDSERCRIISDKARQQLGLEPDDRLVLYAPTYRGSSGSQQTEIPMFREDTVLDALVHRFGGTWKLLYRTHYYGGSGRTLSERSLDVSSYPDMQELLCLADVLITDYSSSIWDFSFTGRPCFLYAPDLKDYRHERDFYSDINTWPGVLAEGEEELLQAIEQFDPGIYESKLQAHQRSLGNCENGTATQRILELLLPKQCSHSN
jgi:CDP-glycerol glycerophosphotransferase